MRLLVVTAVLLAAQVSAGGSETMCAKTCSSSGERQTTYQTGQQYVYLYRGEAATTTAGNHQESSINVAARVIVTVGTSPCDLRLQVPSLEVEGDSTWFKEAVQTHDLYFSYQNGRIEEVCPHQEEHVAATNFKRAVLSMLHTSITNLQTKVIVHESDVAGECETHYHRLNSENDKVVLNKTKHNCLSNVHLPHLLHSHSSSPTMTVMPHFRSNQECRMESQGGVWQNVECQQEVEVDGPLAPTKDSVTLSMSSSLVLETSRSDGNQQAFHQDHILRRESLRMKLEEVVMGGQAQEASHILAQVADTMEVLAMEEGRKEVEWPRMFSHLVNLMGLVQHEQDLEEIWDDYIDQDNYKSIVLDGLLACDSGPCIGLVTRLASETPSHISSPTLSLWLAGLHLHTHANPSSIPHIMSLVKSRPESEEAAVMAASSVVFRLCQKNNTACHTHSQTFLNYVKEEVGEGCGWNQTSQQQHRVKFALRALGNAGVVPQDNFPEKCYKNKMLPTELRVAALQTLRRSGCSGSEAPWKILEDESDGVEVRVAAYLALQPCATVTPQFFPRLQKMLEEEQVNQVGSFIWTHVHNLAEQPAASQEGQDLARLAAQLTLNNKFNTNPFQASRNYRLAQFSEAMGFGGIVDGNVVFSPESYLPQTAALNLTLQLLGKSVNVFEIGGNFKRMEDYVSGIERFFEKGSYFENEDLKNLLKNLRPKREVSTGKLEQYQTMYNEAKIKKGAIEGRNEEPKASMYLRVFGNEMLNSENVLKSDPLKMLQETLQHLSSPRAFQVMNQEFVTPTLLGFPLRLKYNVTGSLSLDKEGRVQPVSPGQLLLEGKLSPTVAVTSDETLLLDGYGFHSGIKRSTTHHAHSHFGGKINIQDGRVIDVQLDLPKTEVVKIYSSVKIALYSNTDQGWSDLAAHSDPGESEGCSSKALSDIIGLQVCHVERSTKIIDTDVASSEPYEKKIVISKTDNFDKFVFSLRQAKNAFEAIIDTPGSSVDRRVSVVVNSHGNGMDSTIVVPRRKVEGEYEWSPTLKKVTLKYYQDSEVHGELDVNLQVVKEGANMRHTPHIVLSWPGLLEVRANGSLLLGPQSIGWNGTVMSSLQSQPAVSQGHWKVVGDQHQASARVNVEQYYASISGSVLRESAITVVEAKSEYGTDSAQPNMLSFSAHFTEKLENKDKSLQGHISIQSSQAEASVNLDVRHQPAHTAVNASISHPNAEINSTFVAKNIGEEGKRDFEMAFSLYSPQLALNYLGRTLYKVSDGDFQAEAEVRLGTLGYTKISVSHLLQCHPFHALAGLHLQFNDHLLQAGYNVDLSRPDQTEIMVSGAVGGASAVFHMEAQHTNTQPFQGLVKVFGGYNEKQVGVILHTTSDDAWQSFNGSMELTWFEQFYVMRYEALWSDGRRGITFSHNQNTFQLMYESSLTPHVSLVVKSSTYPTLQVVVEKTENPQSKTYQAYVMQGADQPLYIGATWNKNESFSGSLRLLKSEVKLSGSLSRPHQHHVEGSARVTIILPSTRSFTTDFTLTHAYDGITRELNVSTISNGHKYEGNFKLKQYDGWFSNDSVSLIVNLTTPLAGLHSAALVVETHSDSSQLSFIQFEVEEIKVRGEAQLGDSVKLFDVKLQYEAGHGNCDSHIHLYHKYVHEKYLTGAAVKLTQEHDPWDLQVVTVLGNTHAKKSLDIEFTSPLLSSPFHFLANYSSSETHFDLKLIGGMENQASLTVSGKNALEDNTKIYGGTLDLQTPWTSPLFMNVSHLHGNHGLNMTLDFHSAWHPVNTVSADLGVIFVNSSDLNANFRLDHEYLQVAMDLGHRLTKGELRNELEFSANVVRVTCKIISTWDENFVPQSATGHISVISKLENPIDFSFSFIKGISDYHTQLIASHSTSLLRVEHQLQAHHFTDWQSELSIVFPNREDVIESKISLNVMPSLSPMKWKFSIKSPWTKEIKSEFSSVTVSTLRETEFIVAYGDSSLAELSLKTPEPFNWYQSNISLNISSSYFSAIDVHWRHKFGNENIVTAEIFVDGEFYLKGEQKLMLSRSELTQDFEQFHFVFMVNIPSNDFDFETNLLFNSNLSGEFEVETGDYLVYVTSLHNAGELLSCVIQGPLEEWKASLTRDPGPSSLPNLRLNVTKDGIDIFTFGSKFTEIYPKLDGLFTFSVRFGNIDLVKHGQLHIVADMSRIKDYAFLGSVKLNTNFEGFEKYWAELDTYVSQKKGIINGNLSGTLYIGDWQYRTNLEALLELYDNFSLSYKNEYILMHHQQILGKKEIILYILVNENLFYGNVTALTGLQAPQWGAFMTYNHQSKEFKAHIIPGNRKKYQIMAHVDANVFKIDSQVVSEDAPSFKLITGDISWIFRRRGQLIRIDLNSDFSMIQNIKGVIGIQRRRRVGVNAKVIVNEVEFNGNVTYIPPRPRAPARVNFEVDNKVFIPFKANLNLTYSVSSRKLESYLAIDLNEHKNWLVSDTKASLDDSVYYSTLKLPFKDFENSTMSLKISMEQFYGVNIEMLLQNHNVTIEGKVDPEFKFVLVSSKVLYNHVNELFDFHFSYEIDKNSFNASSHCRLEKYGDIYRYELMAESTRLFNIDLKGEAQVYTLLSLGLQLSSVTGRNDSSVMIHAYNPVSNWTHFLYQHSAMFNQSDISIEVNERALLSLKTYHDFQNGKFDLNATYSHSISYLPFTATLTANGKMEEKRGELNLGLSTSSPKFSQADLQTVYKLEDNKEGTFKIMSTIGNAEGSIVLQESSDKRSVSFNMTSSLHSFRHYYVKLTHKTEGNNHHFSVQSIQDEVELEMEASFLAKIEGFSTSFRIKTTFKHLETLHVSLGFPHSNSPGNLYTFDINGITSGDFYGFTFTHDHNNNWNMQNTTMIVFTPHEGFGNFSLSAAYDVSSHATMHFSSSEGDISLKAVWLVFRNYLTFNVSFDLSHFGLGKYVLLCNIPYTTSTNGLIQFEYSQAHVNYSCQITGGRNFNFAKLILDLNNPHWAVNKTMYSFGYDFYPRKNLLNLEGQYKEIEANAVLKFKKYIMPLSGVFKVQTNINKYKVINGSWNIGRKDQSYFFETKVNTSEQTMLSLVAQLNSQPQGVPSPWSRLELDVLFESSFTLTHHLHVEYEVNTWTLSSWYKCGFDNFHFKLVPKLKRKVGTFTMTGNIPIRGLSTFNLDFNYKFKEVYTTSLTASVEQTNLIFSVELEPRRSWSSLKASLTSPLFRPMRGSLLWTFKELPWLVESSVTYGDHVGELKIKVNPYGNSKLTELQLNLPFQSFHKSFFTAKYNTNQAGHIFLTSEFSVNNYTLSAESKLKLNNKVTRLEFMGLGNVLGTDGKLELIYENIGNQYTGNSSITYGGTEMLTVYLTVNPRMINFDMKYDMHSYLNAKLTLYQVEIEFFWNKETYLNMSGSLTPHNDGYELHLTLESSETLPMMLKSRYLHRDGQEATASLSVGEKQYNASVKGYVSKKSSSLQLYLYSSESPYSPIIFNAEYNIREYLRGRMTSMMDLASLTFEWGEKIHLLVQGMQTRDQSKMKFELFTPFRSLPMLTFGYDAKFSLARSNIEVMCTTFVEWSQRITLNGIFKLVNGNVDSFVGLTSSYSDLEMCNVSLKFNSSHIEATVTMNKDKWKMTCEYKLYPFSLEISVNTPLEGYRTFILIASGSLQGGRLAAEAEITWTNTIRVQVEAELWDLDIKVQTPWSLLSEASLKMSLRTESEALMYTVTAHWNHFTMVMKTVYSPLQLKIISEYKEDSTEIGYVLFECDLSSRKYKVAAQIRTPFSSFKSAEMEFSMKPKNHDYTINFITNNVEHTLELMFSKKQGKIKVLLPILNKFTWTLEAKKMWQELDTEASISLSEIFAPLKVSLSYLISPDDRKANINVQSEFAHTWVESFNLNFVVTYDGTSLEASSSTEWKPHGKELTDLNSSLTCNINKKHLSMEVKLEGSYFEHPVKLTCKIPLFNFFIKEGAFELAFIHEETHKVTYETTNGDEVYPHHQLTISIPEWSCAAELILKEESFNLSVSFPDLATRHTLSIKWPQLSLEKFAAQLELHSPYLPWEGVAINGSLEVRRKLSFSFNSTASYGHHFIAASGTLHYVKKLHELQFEGKVQSNWIDNYWVAVNVQWLRNIKTNIQVGIADEEHTCSLVINVTNYTLELKCDSSWLPYGNCTIKGKMNSDVSIFNIKVEGELVGFTEGKSLLIEASVSEDDPNVFIANLTIRHGTRQLHQVSAHVTLRKKSLKIKFKIESVDPRLTTMFILHLENNNERRYLSVEISNFFIPDTYIHIENNKNWRKTQEIKFTSSECRFVLTSEISKKYGHLGLEMKYFSLKFHGSTRYDLSKEYSLEADIGTSWDMLQDLSVKMQLPSDENTQLLKIHLRGKDDQQSRVDIHCYPDPVMKWSMWVAILTPMSGFEKFQLMTPQFNYQDHIFRALVEYPGGKVGSILTNRLTDDIWNSNIQISLYLPFEKYEIISLKLVNNDSLVSGKGCYAAEMRVGTVGISVSMIDLSMNHFYNYEFLVRLNEWSIKANWGFISRKENFRTKLYINFVPKDILGIQFFSTQLRYDKYEEFYFIAKSDSKDLLKGHWSWGEAKIFSLTTPRIAPGHLVFHLELGPIVQDCQVETSLSPLLGGSGLPYGFHVQHRQLEAGHHISVFGLAAQTSFYLQGTHHMTSKLLNESLTIKVNEKHVGYNMCLQKHPGMFTSTYTGGMALMLPVHSVYFNTSVISAIRAIDFSSKLTWGKNNSLRQPLNLKMKYDDYSIFNKGRQYLSAVLSHPDMKDITLEANITRTHNSSLFGSAQLVDGNSPEMKMVATMEVEPLSYDRRQTMNLRFSQPASNFTMLMDAQLRQDPFIETLCKLSYYSLTSQTWHRVNLSASLESQGSERAFTVAVVAPEKKWGHTWRGVLDSRQEEASLSLEGSSLEQGDTWKLNSVIKRHMPELVMHLSVGNEEEVYEEGRVRLGLHSPVEAGAVLDHLRFSEWHQDAALGLRLTSPHVLQAFLEFDPSLDYKDEAFVTRLISPVHKVLHSWKNDVTSTVLDVSQWIISEAPTLSQVFVNKQVLQTVWKSEVNSFLDFLTEAERVVSQVSGQTSSFWREVVIPGIQEGFTYISNILKWTQSSLYQSGHHLSLLLHHWTAHLEWRWQVVSYHLASFHHRMRVWWARMEAEMESYLHDTMYWVAFYINRTMIAIQGWVSALSNTFQPLLHTLSWVTNRYSHELSNAFVSECWQPVQRVADQLHHSLGQVIDSSWAILREFLQLETTIPMLTQAYHYITFQTQQALTIIQDDLYQFRESLPDTLHLSLISQLYQNVEDLLVHSLPVLRNLVENGVSVMVPHITSLVDRGMNFIEDRIDDMQAYSRDGILYSYMTELSVNLSDKVLLAWQRWKENDLALDSVTAKSLIEIMKKVLSLDSDIFMESYVFEPETRGRVIYNQHLPMMWPSFLHTPHWHSLTGQSGVSEAQRILQEGVDMTSSSWATRWLPGSLLPPFTATASIIGQHITTFDLHHYQFLGPCSYLLTQDFVGGDFSVVGVYQAEAGVVGLASVEVHTPSGTFVLGVNGSVDTSQSQHEVTLAGIRHCCVYEGIIFKAIFCHWEMDDSQIVPKIYETCHVAFLSKA
ncbi:uncharacterized protein LOC123509550 isoform X2 [Portunus trituberculatus]|uniref:uncharacterized protein LOC123509550 isoform X2 n=1 Tax=Portunus trituberculatus TaxID=210409 RepID=UPI001E1CC0C2|nr:uncharacterized protein LOC123509550 isoform X2 [Portunus trituberculatus]